jgi:tetratricopeptide (TPR) repeat protein
LPETPRLSVCVITKNEEQTLARCLNSVRGIADQIVVVDTGSTDRTVEMARENGAEVYSFAWNDDFSAARNAALEHATGDWVLTLDADEEFPSASHVELRKDTKSNAVFAYRLPLMDAGRENEGFYYVPRLFRNAPGVCYEGRIHEQVRGIAVKDWAFGKAAILHHGYTPQQQQAKNARNLRLLELALREQPEDPNLLMNLGLELARAGRLEAGIEQYALALKKLSALPPGQVVPELREALLTQLGAHLTGAKKFYEVVQLYSSRLAQRGGLTASMHFSLGIAHLQLLQFAEAEEQFRQCLAKRGKPSLCPINTDIMSAGPRHCLAVCLWKLKKTEEAEREFRSALVEDPKSRPLRFEYAMIQAVQQRPVEALKILHELVAEKADEAFVWAAGGQIALSHPDFVEFACDWTGEAVKLFARDVLILQQRAEVLLLNGKADEALTLWRGAAGPRSVAARLICEAATGQTIEPLREDEGAVSREFLNWYRRLVRWGTKGIILKLNENVHTLRNTLPTAVAALEAAFSEVQQPVIV